ncbi:aminomethyl-transferring glycine dehydrogenase subunit GcvPA [Acidobacteriota bacterium]
MNKKKDFVHPYIPNSVPEIKAKMLREIGIKDVEELYADIPEHLRFQRDLNLPEPIESEYGLKSHVEDILKKNQTCEENVSFLGGGCWQHYVPAICDEINQRSEFLTAYAGEPYEDHGRFQVLFEYQSLMAELLDMDVVNVPTYDWCQAASTAIRMAGRITKCNEVLVSDTISPERFSAIRNYCSPGMTIKIIGHDPETGLLNLNELKESISKNTACLFFENPSYLGFIEDRGKEISKIAHENGALSVVSADPISLGVLLPPVQYGADIVCGDIQGLGGHLSYGGAHGGFIATRDEEKYVLEFPSRLFGMTPTTVPGELGFGDVAYERTSFAEREEGKEFVGTHSALCGITAAVYLSLLGPQGIVELGQTIVQKSHYVAKKLNEIPGIKAPRFSTSHFKEFVVDFNATGKTVKEINTFLQEKNVFGGKDLCEEFPDLGQSALFCVTEIHTKSHIDRLLKAMMDCLGLEGEAS